MSQAVFHYKVSGRAGGQRPGAHAGRAGGTGNEFMAHARLFDHPDPRRLDLRASLRAGGDEWLVRTHRQRAAIALYAVVDLSPSMACGMPRKRDVAADFVDAMGKSAFEIGDAAGLCAFDDAARGDLYRPAQHGRQVGPLLADLLRQAPAGMAPTLPASATAHAAADAPPASGLADALQPLAGRQAMVFLLSDFHWPLAQTAAALDLLAHAWVVPVVLWDAAEITPPPAHAFVRLRDAESGALRALWLTPRLRRQWQDNVAQRRAALDALFASRNLRPLYLSGGFDATAVSHYFIEGDIA